jgi:hypothetical protein
MELIFLPIKSVEVNIYLLTYEYLRSSALLEKMPIVQPLKNIRKFYGTRRLITSVEETPYTDFIGG